MRETKRKKAKKRVRLFWLLNTAVSVVEAVSMPFLPLSARAVRVLGPPRAGSAHSER